MNKSSWSNLDDQKIIKYVKNAKGKVVFGIDGFIDQVWQVVETRKSNNEYVLIDKMKKFGQIIVDRGEGGMANELIRKRRAFGGFTANTGRAVGRLDISTILLGMYGKEMVDPIFNELKKNCELITIGEPVISNILEFSDGKIMMPYLNELLNFTWNDLVKRLGHEKLKSIFHDADIVSMGYWSNMPTFDEFITSMNDEYFADSKPKRLFFDFANVKKRSAKALKKTLEVLGNLNNTIPITLSINEHEAVLLFSYYGKKFTDDVEKLSFIISDMRNELNLDEIVIHTHHYVIGCSKSEGIGISDQDYCENPVITTGAGDNFNGGYVASCLGDLNISERLAMANATTRFYIGNGFPPNKDELMTEITRIKGTLG